MFAQHVSMYLNPDSVAEFTRTIENEIIPLLRKEKGFKYAITFVDPNGTEAVGISVWDHRENAQAYYRATYPQVLALLSKVVEGIPEVKNYEVTNSTLHNLRKSAARSAAAARRQVLSLTGGGVRLPYLVGRQKSAERVK